MAYHASYEDYVKLKELVVILVHGFQKIWKMKQPLFIGIANVFFLI
jgi:hypothetical protein